MTVIPKPTSRAPSILFLARVSKGSMLRCIAIMEAATASITDQQVRGRL